jgi:hypothetical protein
MRRRLPVLLLLLIGSASGRVLHARVSAPSQPSKPTDERPQPRKVLQLSREACRLLYCLTAINPLLSVVGNEYTSVLTRDSPRSQNPTAAAVYRTLFYFAKLKPRLVFVVGSCLRALQQTTVLQLVFDPCAGVCAGLDFLAWFVSSRWPSPLVLGWVVSKPFWQLLRAAPPPSVKVPISVTPRWREEAA